MVERSNNKQQMFANVSRKQAIIEDISIYYLRIIPLIKFSFKI